MPSDRYQWLQRVRAVEREYLAMRYACDYLLKVISQDRSELAGNLRVRDIHQATDRLEGTYAIRLFAEFETGLRKYWDASRGNDPPSRARDLLDGIAAQRRIPDERIQNAHAVREYRNSLVHERDEHTEQIPLATVRSHLCYYLSFLPVKW